MIVLVINFEIKVRNTHILGTTGYVSKPADRIVNQPMTNLVMIKFDPVCCFPNL